MQFSDLGLSEAALAAVEQLGYVTPTPIQEQAIPAAMEGRDIIAAAKTGTGKTAAFALPIVCRTKPQHHHKTPSALVISPTRELAQQTGAVFTELGKTTKHRAAICVGGVAYGPQIKQLRCGIDVLIATPGRMLDLVDHRAIDLSRVEILVLDEADRMLDMGFWPSISEVIDMLPEDRQTLLFSATIDDNVMSKMSGVMKDPDIIEISQKGDTPEEVNQCVMPVSQSGKDNLLNAVLNEHDEGQIIVFARTKIRSDECAEKLCANGHNAEAIHSGLSQSERRHALDNFAHGRTRILVATDVLARGIDVSGVESVINFDLPDSPEDYVHRIGRTGRAGQTGNAISFVTSGTRNNLRDIERLLGQTIPTVQMEGYTEELPSRSRKSSSTSRPARPARSGRPARQPRENRSFHEEHSADARPTRDASSKPAYDQPRKTVEESGEKVESSERTEHRDHSDSRDERTDRGNRSYGSHNDHRSDSRRDSHDDHRSNGDSRDFRSSRDDRRSSDSRDFHSSRDDRRGSSDSRDFGNSRSNGDSRDFGNSRSNGDSRDFRNSRSDSRDFRNSDSRGRSEGNGSWHKDTRTSRDERPEYSDSASRSSVRPGMHSSGMPVGSDRNGSSNRGQGQSRGSYGKRTYGTRDGADSRGGEKGSWNRSDRSDYRGGNHSEHSGNGHYDHADSSRPARSGNGRSEGYRSNDNHSYDDRKHSTRPGNDYISRGKARAAAKNHDAA